MKLNSPAARRIGAATVAACTAILIPAVALAAPGRTASASAAAASAAARRMAACVARGSTPASASRATLQELAGSRRACVLDRRIQALPVKYRAISDVCHPHPLCGLAR